MSPETCHWYAMKVFHNKAFKLEEEISSQLGLECYVPREKVVVETVTVNGFVKSDRPLPVCCF